MSITIDTAGLNLSDQEAMHYKSLFKFILYYAKEQRVRGQITIPLSGNGTVGTCKVESFHDVSGNGKSPQEHNVEKKTQSA